MRATLAFVISVAIAAAVYAVAREEPSAALVGEAALEHTGPARCVVWATTVSTLLAGDRIHGSASGYARRARAIATAARACAE